MGTSADSRHVAHEGKFDHIFTCYTILCDREEAGVETRNITLSLPEEVLREAKVVAARRGTSVSALLAGALYELVERESGYAAARERSLATLGRGRDLGTGGAIGWDRDELHDR